MESSILISTKKVLGIPEADTSFDLDVIMHINTAFGVLMQLGIGPDEGFAIEDELAVWNDFIDVLDPTGSINNLALQNIVRTYVFLKVKMLFDPPNTSYLITAMTEQIEEYEWRLMTLKETV
jgi:hypothetical protein